MCRTHVNFFSKRIAREILYKLILEKLPRRIYSLQLYLTTTVMHQNGLLSNVKLFNVIFALFLLQGMANDIVTQTFYVLRGKVPKSAENDIHL